MVWIAQALEPVIGRSSKVGKGGALKDCHTVLVREEMIGISVRGRTTDKVPSLSLALASEATYNENEPKQEHELQQDSQSLSCKWTVVKAGSSRC